MMMEACYSETDSEDEHVVEEGQVMYFGEEIDNREKGGKSRWRNDEDDVTKEFEEEKEGGKMSEETSRREWGKNEELDEEINRYQQQLKDPRTSENEKNWAKTRLRKLELIKLSGIMHERCQLAYAERTAVKKGDDTEVLAAVRAQASRVMLHVGDNWCHLCKNNKPQCYRPRLDTCTIDYTVVRQEEAQMQDDTRKKRTLGPHTVCLGCLKNHFRGTRLLEKGECPVCNFFCTCRLCLRDASARSLAAPEYRDFAMSSVHSKTLLACKLEQTYRLTMAIVEGEAKTLGIPVKEDTSAADIVEHVIEKTQEYPPCAYERVTCSNCLMSVVNLFYRCEQCELEICMTCHKKYVEEPTRQTLTRAHGDALKEEEWAPSDVEAKCVAGDEAELGEASRHRFVACRAMEKAALRKLAIDLDACKQKLCGEGKLTENPTPESEACGSDDIADGVKRFEMHQFTDGTDETRERLLEDFHDNWHRARPVVVSRCTTLVNWTPGTMMRMMRDLTPENYVTTTPAYDCTTFNAHETEIQTYFAWHEKMKKPLHGHLWRLKDWPDDENFAERLPRLARDFVFSLPFQEYCFPWDNGGARRGMMNAAIDLPEVCNRADLGPKSYISMGRQQECGAVAGKPEGKEGGGDAVTRIHCDMADAVNLLIHTSGAVDGEKFDVSGGCALWDIWRRKDRKVLEEWLRTNSERFTERDPGKVVHAIHDQCFYLTSEDKEALKAECGIEAYTFEQKLDDAVFIPAGCPHQVRNLQSCIKVALDFVSPESMPMCLTLSNEFSHSKGTGDKIQIRSIIAHSFQKTLRKVYPEYDVQCPETRAQNEEPSSKKAKTSKKGKRQQKKKVELEEVEKQPMEEVKQSIEPYEDTMRDQTLEDATQSQHCSPQQTQTNANRKDQPTMLSPSLQPPPLPQPSDLLLQEEMLCCVQPRA